MSWDPRHAGSPVNTAGLVQIALFLIIGPPSWHAALQRRCFHNRTFPLKGSVITVWDSHAVREVSIFTVDQGKGDVGRLFGSRIMYFSETTAAACRIWDVEETKYYNNLSVVTTLIFRPFKFESHFHTARRRRDEAAKIPTETFVHASICSVIALAELVVALLPWRN